MEHKIIFAGQVGSGKTTAIKTISDIDMVSTEAKASDDVAKRKETTTVAMDYGVLNLDGGNRVHLYGTPGQDRFSFMWDILTAGGLGLVILIDNARITPESELEHYLNSFSKFIANSPVAIGITRMDVMAVPRLSSYQKTLDKLQLKAPLFEVDARRENDVKTLLQSLLVRMELGL